MADAAVVFDDGVAYEAFMGRWSRAIGAVFLDWFAPPFAPPKGACWLDVGCGTGVFTELVLEMCSPAAVMAVDPAAAQIDYARRRPGAPRANFRVADAQTLPFADQTFDVVASALVLNFIPDRLRALAEMRRVARPGGAVGGYVWDFAAGRSPTWPLARAMRHIGIEPPRIPGADGSGLELLHALFDQAGFEDIAVRSIDVMVEFPDFDSYWRTQTPVFNPLGKAIAAMPDAERVKVIDAVRAELPASPNGSIVYSVRANAVKSRVPVSGS